MRIAIVGSGISALVAAYHLQPRHDVVVFEKDDRVGGHSHTIGVDDDGRELGVDTGFIVYNERTYPVFTRLLGELGVATQTSEMSFGVQCRRCRLEYSGSGLAGLFAQKSRFFRAGHYRFLLDILRFNRDGLRVLEEPRLGERPVLGYLQERGYSNAFIHHYVVPMGAAIWSCGTGKFGEFPLLHFLRFFRNHGLLTVADQPVWRTVRGGSREYVRALTQGFADRIRTSTPARAIRRRPDGVELVVEGGERALFDRVVIGTHADQALALLADATDEERRGLECMPYQTNEAILHTDERVLPKHRAAWASWNVQLDDCARIDAPLAMTYSMNRLQRLEAKRHYLVTLNDDSEIAPDRIIRRIAYEHPVYTMATLAGQARLRELNGERGTYFCGAYLGYGFHEDGARSGLEVALAIDGEERKAA
ncbi:MAG: NAD(P)/FAD-dependent oxidoreductase [Candidatus Binatia bacterium]